MCLYGETPYRGTEDKYIFVWKKFRLYKRKLLRSYFGYGNDIYGTDCWITSKKIDSTDSKYNWGFHASLLNYISFNINPQTTEVRIVKLKSILATDADDICAKEMMILERPYKVVNGTIVPKFETMKQFLDLTNESNTCKIKYRQSGNVY